MQDGRFWNATSLDSRSDVQGSRVSECCYVVLLVCCRNAKKNNKVKLKKKKE